MLATTVAVKTEKKKGQAEGCLRCPHGLDGDIVIAQIASLAALNYFFFFFSARFVCRPYPALWCWSFPSPISPTPSFTLDLAVITTCKPSLIFGKKNPKLE